MTLHCATTNPGKLREFRLAVETFGGERFTVEALPGLRGIPAPDETGSTFEENAIEKAVYYSRYSDQCVFVDDSGLAVDALGGAPGVYSARFAGPHATDSANNSLLLQKLQGTAHRDAQFVCVVALAQRGAVLSTFSGIARGLILEEPRGEGGFGYDPLFFYPPRGVTFAELSPAEKLAESHRGKALRAMVQWLAQHRAG